MDGQTDEHTEEWVDRQRTYQRVDEQTDKCTKGETGRQTNIRMDRWAGRRTDRLVGGQRYELMVGWVDRLMG